jgi:RNA polymerase sigma-70 factor (ECF subfamily)
MDALAAMLTIRLDFRGMSAVVHSPTDDASRAMDRYAAGDDTAFGEVYDALAPRLFAYLMRQTRSRERAEDLVQQTLLQIHRARGSFLPGSQIMPWAFAIARRLLIDSIRRGRREMLARTDEEEAREPVAPDASADELLLAQETAEVIQRELARLP